MHDGCRVEYTGIGEGPVIPGDQGAVLIMSGEGAHVQWKTGRMAGQVTLVDTFDLSPIVSNHREDIEESLNDSLEVLGLGSVTARHIYDEEGGEALLNAMVDAGRLTPLREFAEDALARMSSGIRRSPSFSVLTSHFDDDETDEMILRISALLVREALDES